jgi:hypothetical protein
MEFNNIYFKKFREDCNAALKSVAEKYNLSINVGHISYSDDTFSAKMECQKTDAGDIGLKEFKRYCQLFGFQKEDYNREFTMDGRRFKLVGFNLKSPKNCCQIVDTKTGKQYRTTDKAVQLAFEKKETL